MSEPPRFVSRGGIKLENALEAFGLDVAGLDCLDVGASTGGFTDCLLQRGAARVIALDVGRGQLDWGLRNDPRVVVVERRNARDLDAGELPSRPIWRPSTSPSSRSPRCCRRVAACVAADGELLALVKPQFELGPERVGKGGVVRDPEDRREALRTVAGAAADVGLAVRGFASSGLPGPEGQPRDLHPPGAAPARRSEIWSAAIAEVEP